MNPPTCRSCGAPLNRTVVDLGTTPLANRFLTATELDEPEPAYPLHVRVCDQCLLVQIDEVTTPEDIFGDYAYFSSFSETWLRHAAAFADHAIRRFGLSDESFVVEIASNDGYLLRRFVEQRIPVLGIEPARNVAAVAEEAGVPTMCRFFGADVARELVDRGMRADLIVANNVLAHVPDLNDFVRGIAVLLTPEGHVSIEFPHVLELLEHVQFDTIYHEHFCYFSLASAEAVLARHGLEVVDVAALATHGGSLRLTARHRGAQAEPAAAVQELRAREAAAGLLRTETYEGFAAQVQRACESLRELVRSERSAGHRIAAYAATAKGNTLLNVAEIGADDIDYVADRNPYKQGRWTPGARVPVVSPDELEQNPPDVLLVLAWNIVDEILQQLDWLVARGCRFVVPIPQAHVVS